MAVGKLLELLVDEYKLHDELNDNTENVCDDCNRTFQNKASNHINDDHHVDVDVRDTCCNSNNGDNFPVSLPDVILADDNNVNLNDYGVISDMHDNDVDNDENEGASNANRIALNKNGAASNDQSEFSW